MTTLSAAILQLYETPSTQPRAAYSLPENTYFHTTKRKLMLNIGMRLSQFHYTFPLTDV